MDVEVNNSISAFIHNFVLESAITINWLDKFYKPDTLLCLHIFRSNIPYFKEENVGYINQKLTYHSLGITNIVYLNEFYTGIPLMENLYLVSWIGQCKINNVIYGFVNTIVISLVTSVLINYQIMQIFI